jgi:hypothetical protein
MSRSSADRLRGDFRDGAVHVLLRVLEAFTRCVLDAGHQVPAANTTLAHNHEGGFERCLMIFRQIGIADVTVAANPDRRAFRQFAAAAALQPLVKLYGTTPHIACTTVPS